MAACFNTKKVNEQNNAKQCKLNILQVLVNKKTVLVSFVEIMKSTEGK